MGSTLEVQVVNFEQIFEVLDSCFNFGCGSGAGTPGGNLLGVPKKTGGFVFRPVAWDPGLVASCWM